jgi:hypothetical protein
MTRRQLAPCHCPKNSVDLWTCRRTATAEDLLCDVCRIGCRRTWVGGATGGRIPHTSSPAALYRARYGTPPRSQDGELP